MPRGRTKDQSPPPEDVFTFLPIGPAVSSDRRPISEPIRHPALRLRRARQIMFAGGFWCRSRHRCVLLCLRTWGGRGPVSSDVSAKWRRCEGMCLLPLRRSTFAKSQIWQRPNRRVLSKTNLWFDGAGAPLRPSSRTRKQLQQSNLKINVHLHHTPG